MAIDDARNVLIAIFTQLANLDAEVVGKVGLGYESISALDDKLTLTVDVQHDPSWHPSIAHCHVFAHLAGDCQVSLEACAVGVAASRNAALLECAITWIEMVAGPLFSLLHAKPVLGAVHFDGAEYGGFAGGHGFLGPVGAKMFQSFPTADVLERIASFEHAAEISPPEIIHLAKVVVQATTNGWQRTLEIDGHRAVFSDMLQLTAQRPPSQGVVTRFAVYSLIGGAEGAGTRNRTDEAIRRYVELFGKTHDSRAAALALIDAGFQRELAERIYAFTPLAFARGLFNSLGVQFSPSYSEVDTNGAIRDGLHLMSEPVFARSAVLSAELLRNESSHTIQQLSRTSAETHALNAALNAGLLPNQIVGAPPRVVNQAESLPIVTVSFSERASSSMLRISGKSWWRFWR